MTSNTFKVLSVVHGVCVQKGDQFNIDDPKLVNKFNYYLSILLCPSLSLSHVLVLVCVCAYLRWIVLMTLVLEHACFGRTLLLMPRIFLSLFFIVKIAVFSRHSFFFFCSFARLNTDWRNTIYFLQCFHFDCVCLHVFELFLSSSSSSFLLIKLCTVCGFCVCAKTNWHLVTQRDSINSVLQNK